VKRAYLFLGSQLKDLHPCFPILDMEADIVIHCHALVSKNHKKIMYNLKYNVSERHLSNCLLFCVKY